MARMPRDLENIIIEAIETGLQNEDSIEDAVSKIQSYRELFGVACAGAEVHLSSSGSSEFQNVDEMIRDVLAEQAASLHKIQDLQEEDDLSPKKASANVRHVMFQDDVPKKQVASFVEPPKQEPVKQSKPQPQPAAEVVQQQQTSFKRQNTPMFKSQPKPTPQAQAVQNKNYKPQNLNRDDKEMEFEESASFKQKINNTQKQLVVDSDSDSDERTPNLLILKAQDSILQIRNAFSHMPDILKRVLSEKALQSNLIRDELVFLNELIVKQSDKTGGWSMFPNPQIVLEIIGRDEYRLEESKIWGAFCKDYVTQVEITGVILVPGKILIAVGKPVGRLSEVPCFALAKNNWTYTASQSMEFCEQAVQRRGSPFRDMVGSSKSKSTSIKTRFAESPFTVYYSGLDTEINLSFVAQIIY